MRCLAMSVQFAVLASGSRGNSYAGARSRCRIVDRCGHRAQGHRRPARERRSDLVADRRRGLDAHPRRSCRYRGIRRNGAARRVSPLPRSASERTRPETPGFRKLEEAGLIRPYDDAPFLTSTGLRLEPIELRHDGGPTFGFRIEASAGRRQRPVSIGYLADTGTWSETMVESLADVDVLGVEFNHDEGLQKVVPAPRVLDRAKPGRSRAPVEPTRGRPDPGGSRSDHVLARCATWCYST